MAGKICLATNHKVYFLRYLQYLQDPVQNPCEYLELELDLNLESDFNLAID